MFRPFRWAPAYGHGMIPAIATLLAVAHTPHVQSSHGVHLSGWIIAVIAIVVLGVMGIMTGIVLTLGLLRFRH